MPDNEVTITLNRPRRVYNQGDYLAGSVVITNKYELKHEGLTVSIEGSVDINPNVKSMNFLDIFQEPSKSIQLIDFAFEALKAGRLEPGRTEIPFKLPVDNNVDKSTLFETYHGVFISVQYLLKCCLKRPMIFRDITDSIEFFVEYDVSPIGAPAFTKQPTTFEVTPSTLSATRRAAIPDFKICGHLDSLTCRLSDPIQGEFTIEKCDAIIRSVELQLVRVETCGNSPMNRDFSKDATEVQNIQIADGNLLRNVPIPIYMVLPRLFTCPTLITDRFKIANTMRNCSPLPEFELNLVVIFNDNYLITENFPLKVIRSMLQPVSSP